MWKVLVSTSVEGTCEYMGVEGTCEYIHECGRYLPK